MIKKITLSVCTLMMFYLSAAIVIRQNSKSEVADTFIRARAADDQQILWQLISPPIRTRLTARLGKDAALRTVLEKLPMNSRRERKLLRKTLKNSAADAEALVNGKLDYVNISGKWFLKLPGEKIDHSDQAAVAEAFLAALAHGDGELFWECLPPERQKEGIAQCGSKTVAVKMLTLLISNQPEAQRKKFQATLADPYAKKVYLNNAVNDHKAWVHEDGKWYLDPDKMK